MSGDQNQHNHMVGSQNLRHLDPTDRFENVGISIFGPTVSHLYHGDSIIHLKMYKEKILSTKYPYSQEMQKAKKQIQEPCTIVGFGSAEYDLGQL